VTALRAEVLVVGSGAGGAATAWTLAEAGLDVVLLEEGARHAPEDYGAPPSVAFGRLYRNRGMTPILGRVPIGYVEGRCLGGSTEINSGFWHRAPRETLQRWEATYGLEHATEDALRPHYEWAESALGVGLHAGPWPRSTELFAKGIARMGWSYQEVPRAAPGCRGTNRCAQGCPTGAKQGMTRRLLPEAEARGVRVVTGMRVLQVLIEGDRAVGVVGHLSRPGRPRELVRLDADHVFVCAGPTESPALLLKSGIKHHVGNSLRVHPYLKVAARFDEDVGATGTVLPLLQVKEFAPELSLGGAFFNPGQLAMTLGDGDGDASAVHRDAARSALYYAGVRGSGRGWVRPALLGEDATEIRYELSGADAARLRTGLARLAEILIASGAREVRAAVHGLPPIRAERDAVSLLDADVAADRMSLVTVHAFSSCPAGTDRARCAVDSFGRVYGTRNLLVNDASILPDSPGVNPQGTVMALARRNALAFVEARRKPADPQPG